MASQQPSGPSQPSKSEAYTTASNPVTQNDAERVATENKGADYTGRYATEVRGPWSENPEAEGIPTALGQGAVRGSNPTNQAEAHDARYGSGTRLQNENVDAEQMATFSEGKVADAVERKSGTQRHGGENVQFDDYASDLNRKKAEQAEAREAVQRARRAGSDVDGGAVQRQHGAVLD